MKFEVLSQFVVDVSSLSVGALHSLQIHSMRVKGRLQHGVLKFEGRNALEYYLIAVLHAPRNVTPFSWGN